MIDDIIVFSPAPIAFTGTALPRLCAHRYMSISQRKWRRLLCIVGSSWPTSGASVPPSAFLTFQISTQVFPVYYRGFFVPLMRKCILMHLGLPNRPAYLVAFAHNYRGKFGRRAAKYQLGVGRSLLPDVFALEWETWHGSTIHPRINDK